MAAAANKKLRAAVYPETDDMGEGLLQRHVGETSPIPPQGLLIAMMTDTSSIARYLRSLGEPTEAPARSPPRGPPYWKSVVLRRAALGDDA